MVVGREVGGCLHADVTVQHEPGHGDGARQIGGAGPGRVGPREGRLGKEVLDDDLLHVPRGAVQVAMAIRCRLAPPASRRCRSGGRW